MSMTSPVIGYAESAAKQSPAETINRATDDLESAVDVLQGFYERVQGITSGNSPVAEVRSAYSLVSTLNGTPNLIREQAQRIRAIVSELEALLL